ncbi:hypothetical protein MKX03_020587 [Papaver bracteatum]|nr:hypothetical protein MKX03_020587 [Papaver bracteatum]
MTGLCVADSLSSSSPPVSDGELNLQPLSLGNGDLKKSSSTSVQCTPDIEKKYVHRVYEAIAPHFSSTRFAKWPKVSTFLNALPRGSLVLDAGCGNGKYLGLNPECFYIGCDISPPLINICLDRGNEVMVADAVNMPYRNDFGDAVISIAVLHHLSTESRRIKAIEELLRVVRKGGLALITVWAVEQEDRTLLTKWTPLAEKYSSEWVGPGSPCVRSSPSPFALGRIPETDENGGNRIKYDSEEKREHEHVAIDEEGSSLTSGNENDIDSQQEYFVPWHLPYHRAEISGASVGALASGLAKRDEKKGTVVYNRYYHVFKEGELERLTYGIKNAVIRDRFYDKSNWCIILEKT